MASKNAESQQKFSAGKLLNESGSFLHRHIGPSEQDCHAMLEVLGFPTLDAMVDKTVPSQIRTGVPLKLEKARSEYAALCRLREIASMNQVFRSYIGMGYYDTITPPVIQRNILENPGWYTQYTPYQPEISQGRLEALLNFQTMIADLTGLPVANASLLDEGTAAAEAMNMCYGLSKEERNCFFVSEQCHPQTIEAVKTRADAKGINVLVGDHETFDFSRPVCGVLAQYPAADGSICDYSSFVERAHRAGAVVTVAADLLSLTLLRPPGEFGADIAVGTTQRFGVPLGYGGPHAAYLSARDEHKRSMPGRIVGVSKDAQGNDALRLSLQTREQHIRREKATSNICTAQVLLAVMASMYAVYHGPSGLRKIAARIHLLTAVLAKGLERLGYSLAPGLFFDTLRVNLGKRRLADILDAARARKINLRVIDDTAVGVSLDETVTVRDLQDLFEVFGAGTGLQEAEIEGLAEAVDASYPAPFARASSYLTHPVFHRYHSETELLRYMRRLEGRDLSLTASMIPLGSCTMKLNAAAEMYPVSWREFGKLHPFAPLDQAAGYQVLFKELEQSLREITGFAGVSLQPNSGAQGEFTGLLVISKYLQGRGEGHRKVCLIPHSAHGTNPASAIMAGFRVVVVECDDMGNIDVADLRAKAEAHAHDLGALMVTYPSTHGVFEEAIKEICAIVHQHGGQVYMDGANMNAQVGLCRPAELGADVCHLNLHKTFAIPHGGGGPGVGPIAVAPHLTPFLPGHPIVTVGGERRIGPVSAAPFGSASILPISWVYIALMGPEGLTEATKYAILNANYIARRLDPFYPVVYKGTHGMIAHECILDLRPLKKSAGIEVDDIAKRLMDYGIHAPTVSFPVAGTMMVEPTESESKAELDRFCEAMIAIRKEVEAIEQGRMDPKDNLLKNAPHTAKALVAPEWTHPYSRIEAAYPSESTRESKFWPAVGRIDAVYGDRNLLCVLKRVRGKTGEGL
jgi:glycine dehydrogenase